MIFLIIFTSNEYLIRSAVDAMTWERMNQEADWLRYILVNNAQLDIILDNLCQEPSGSGMYCQWEWHADAHKSLHLSPSLAKNPILLPEIKSNEHIKMTAPEPGGGEMMVVAISVVLTKGELILAVGKGRSLQRDQLRKWRLYNLLLTFFLFLIFALLARWYITKVLEIFYQLNRQIEKIQSGARKNLPLEAPEEIRPLVQIMDRLLDAEERHLQRLRRTLSHIGHSLRIPVTVLFHLAEAPELQNHHHIKTILTEQTTLLERLIERNLRRASLVGRSTHGDVFRLGQEIPAMVRALYILHYDKELEIITRIPETLNYSGNRDDILELIGNLADNACKWATSKVIISMGGEGGFWLTIEDDGPGVHESQLERLHQWTGERLDENQHGFGMGLVIARDIVEFYQGEINLGRSSELGGFMVNIKLLKSDERSMT
ncbi:MAG: sensor histidine kinase [Magnetococcus sp. DMHC-6]